VGTFPVAEKPTYEELAKRVKELESEKLQANIIKGPLIKSSEWLSDKLDLQPSPEISSLDVDLESIINTEEIQSIMDDFCCLTNMVTAVLDLKGKVIVATGWQDICTKFHRINPKTACNCTESDLFLAKNLKPGEYIEYKCKNGLWDVVTPLYIGAKHLGNIFTGQFFYDDEKVDENFFIKQADKYGFDKESYLESFKRVPRYSRDTIDHLMDFLVKFTTYISKISLSNIQLEKEIKKRKKTENALRISEEKYATTLYSIGDGVISTDENGLIVQMNPMAENLCGWNLADAAGKPLAEVFRIVNAQTREIVADPVKKVLASKEVVGLANHTILISKNGSEYQIADSAAPIKTKKGEIRGVVLVFSDVTEKYLDQEQIRQSEQRYSALLQNLEAGIVVHALDTSVVMNNPRASELLGLSNDQMKGKTAIDPDWKFVNEDNMPLSLEEYPVNRILTSKKSIRNQILGIHRPGTKEIIWVTVNGFLMFDSTGEFTQIVISFIDITERKLADEALQEYDEDLKESQRISHVGSWRLDISTNEVNWSEELYKMYGFDPSLPIPPYNEHHKIFTPESWDRLSRALPETIETGIPYELELETVRKDGSNGWMWVRGEATLDAKGKIIGLRGAAQDITDRKLIEKENIKLLGQLQQAQKMESVGRLAGGVAHDFNNMLGVILGHTEMVMEQMDSSHQFFLNLQEIQNAAMRSADLTRQLLAFARKQTISPKVLDLNKMVDGMLNMLQRLIGEDIDLVWLPGKDLWPVNIDPSQIDQILANLCVNARDAIAGVGKLTIETGICTFDESYCAVHMGFISGEYVFLAVSDNGSGMDAETKGKIFEPFFTTKPMDKGTGLGLSTVYGIVKQNNGFINVYSEPGQGTTFKIYLSRHTGKAGQLQQKIPKEPVSHGNETILLVEDEPAILNLTTMMLQRLGYTVLPASTPGEAIRLAREHMGKIDLLMTDVVMPEMNGRDLARNLLSLNPSLKRLFMSGYTANVIAHHGVLDEGVHFLQKPFSKKDLADSIKEALEE